MSLLRAVSLFFFFNDTATTEIYTLSIHDALPIYNQLVREAQRPSWTLSLRHQPGVCRDVASNPRLMARSEEHTSELQSRSDLVCRLLLEKKNNTDRQLSLPYY